MLPVRSQARKDYKIQSYSTGSWEYREQMGGRAPSTPIFSFDIQPKALEQIVGVLLVFWSFCVRTSHSFVCKLGVCQP